MSKLSKNRRVTTGNAKKDSQNTRGWFLGAFIEPRDSLQSNEAVEVKWGEHPKGEVRSSKAGDGEATTLCLFVRGRFGIKFENQQEVVLEKEGDYAMWTPNIPHDTVSYEDSLVITVRWPSLSPKKN